jgi:hypothetical protein
LIWRSIIPSDWCPKLHAHVLVACASSVSE